VKELDVVATIETNDPSKVVSLAAVYLVGINITFRLMASNGRFSGEAPFCVRTDQLASFASQLDKLPLAPDAARLDDADSDGHIDLWRTDELGHIGVRVHVGVSTGDHAVLSFETDQTALPLFLDTIRELGAVAGE
jgi:hypothetical protein